MNGKDPRNRRRFGARQEQLAADHLIGQGLVLITSNYQCKVGEIDLIMKDRESLVFVEVRYRTSVCYGSPVETVTLAKQRRLWRCARFFLQRQQLDDTMPCRFDVLGISPVGQNHSFTWVRNAFQFS